MLEADAAAAGRRAAAATARGRRRVERGMAGSVGARSGSVPAIRRGSNPFAWETARADHPGMQLLRIDHVSLNVHDRTAALAWYEEVLGLRPAARPDTPPDQPVFLGPMGARLGLFADRAP